MWTDKNGKSVTAGTTAPIHAPFSGVMQVFLDQGDQFDEGDPIFRIDPR
jgi:multidrug resistance efflux pump